MPEEKVLELDGLKTCPFDECGRATPASDSNECAVCRAQYQVCPRCGTRNQRFATYCRWDGELLLGSVASWKQDGADAKRTGCVSLWTDEPAALVTHFESRLEERPHGIAGIAGGLVSSFKALYCLDAGGNLREISQTDLHVTRTWPLPNANVCRDSINSPVIDGMSIFVAGATELFHVRLDRPELAPTRFVLPPKYVVMDNGIVPGKDCLFLAVRDEGGKCHRLLCVWKDLTRGIRWDAEMGDLRIGGPVIVDGRCVVGASCGRVMMFEEAVGTSPVAQTATNMAAAEGYLTFVAPTVDGTRVIFAAARDDAHHQRQLYRVDAGSRELVPTPFAKLPSCGPVGLATGNHWVFVQTNETIYVLDAFSDRLDLHMGGDMNLQSAAPTIVGSYLFSPGGAGAGRIHVHAVDSLARNLRPCALVTRIATQYQTPPFVSIVPGENAVFGARADGYLCKIEPVRIKSTGGGATSP